MKIPQMYRQATLDLAARWCELSLKPKKDVMERRCGFFEVTLEQVFVVLQALRDKSGVSLTGLPQDAKLVDVRIRSSPNPWVLDRLAIFVESSELPLVVEGSEWRRFEVQIVGPSCLLPPDS